MGMCQVLTFRLLFVYNLQYVFLWNLGICSTHVASQRKLNTSSCLALNRTIASGPGSPYGLSLWIMSTGFLLYTERYGTTACLLWPGCSLSHLLSVENL